MDYFEINGSNKLNGVVEVSGAKNAVLPLMAAAILNKDKLKISNVPTLSDSITMSKLLEEMGAEVNFESDNSIFVDSSNLDTPFAPYDLVKTMRASFYVLGPLLARFGKAKVSLPGGCAWGPRPVDFHLEGLKALGVKISIENGYVVADGSNLTGNKIHFPKISVGATGNIVMVAILAKGTTTITNAASEPEIQQLCEMLNSMGANISGIGTNTLTIKGVTSLNSISNISVIPDRIEAGTFCVAATLTKGSLEIKNFNSKMINSEINLLKNVGAKIKVYNNKIFIKGPNIIKNIKNIKTKELSTILSTKILTN